MAGAGKTRSKGKFTKKQLLRSLRAPAVGGGGVYSQPKARIDAIKTGQTAKLVKARLWGRMAANRPGILRSDTTRAYQSGGPTARRSPKSRVNPFVYSGSKRVRDGGVKVSRRKGG